MAICHSGMLRGFFAVQGLSTANLVGITVIFFCLGSSVISDGRVTRERVTQ